MSTETVHSFYIATSPTRTRMQRCKDARMCEEATVVANRQNWNSRSMTTHGMQPSPPKKALQSCMPPCSTDHYNPSDSCQSTKPCWEPQHLQKESYLHSTLSIINQMEKNSHQQCHSLLRADCPGQCMSTRWDRCRMLWKHVRVLDLSRTGHYITLHHTTSPMRTLCTRESSKQTPDNNFDVLTTMQQSLYHLFYWFTCESSQELDEHIQGQSGSHAWRWISFHAWRANMKPIRLSCMKCARCTHNDGTLLHYTHINNYKPSQWLHGSCP